MTVMIHSKYFPSYCAIIMDELKCIMHARHVFWQTKTCLAKAYSTLVSSKVDKYQFELKLCVIKEPMFQNHVLKFVITLCYQSTNPSCIMLYTVYTKYCYKEGTCSKFISRCWRKKRQKKARQINGCLNCIELHHRFKHLHDLI